jgi:hypothetical protein
MLRNNRIKLSNTDNATQQQNQVIKHWQCYVTTESSYQTLTMLRNNRIKLSNTDNATEQQNLVIKHWQCYVTTESSYQTLTMLCNNRINFWAIPISILQTELQNSKNWLSNCKTGMTNCSVWMPLFTWTIW